MLASTATTLPNSLNFVQTVNGEAFINPVTGISRDYRIGLTPLQSATSINAYADPFQTLSEATLGNFITTVGSNLGLPTSIGNFPFGVGVNLPFNPNVVNGINGITGLGLNTSGIVPFNTLNGANIWPTNSLNIPFPHGLQNWGINGISPVTGLPCGANPWLGHLGQGMVSPMVAGMGNTSPVENHIVGNQLQNMNTMIGLNNVPGVNTMQNTGFFPATNFGGFANQFAPRFGGGLQGGTWSPFGNGTPSNFMTGMENVRFIDNDTETVIEIFMPGINAANTEVTAIGHEIRIRLIGGGTVTGLDSFFSVPMPLYGEGSQIQASASNELLRLVVPTRKEIASKIKKVKPSKMK